MTLNNKDFVSHKMVLAKFVYPVICKPIDISRDHNKTKKEVPGPQIICVPRITFTNWRKFDAAILFSHIDKLTTKYLLSAWYPRHYNTCFGEGGSGCTRRKVSLQDVYNLVREKKNYKEHHCKIALVCVTQGVFAVKRRERLAQRSVYSVKSSSKTMWSEAEEKKN